MSAPKSRRRGEQLEQAILDAAWAELNEVGYSRLTIEAVAARAQTSKPVIYRRWSSRAELVLAASHRQNPVRTPHEAPDTGALRTDLLEVFTLIARRAEMMSEMIAGVMGETFRHPEVTALLRQRLNSSPLAETMTTIVRNAAERGELAPVELTPRVLRLPIDLFRADMLLCGGTVPAETIASMVDEIYLPLLRGLAVSAD
ncbi:TetR/AcrR family transcriptional regulator [Crossiella sp. CA-258035]|uniref:TetR/AcrR family transcriptional regulator n=1 Tax=Crossiella sp. CA-258035 TaxID=2981138 RepID=UPI0024BC4298|nr:TetR/AcrR family transcriptional regulator [Crossiella sp. CA-258035]WHT22463.1 TetR/AcrR family transcriptional regulator [Crossiella sp. CA-258035]